MDRRHVCSCLMWRLQTLASTVVWPVTRLEAAPRALTSPCLVIPKQSVYLTSSHSVNVSDYWPKTFYFNPEPPKISSTSSPGELTIALNSPLELECSAVGVPPPTLSWLKDGRPLEAADIVQQDGHYVKISKVQVSFKWTISCYCNVLILMSKRTCRSCCESK